ncbi:Serine/threonine-protein kinase [Hordeum vulgare]|nr:Serine/threonine-protein kinase [Hordeum vulgare]
MEQLLAEDKYQVVGFDLKFTSGCVGQDQKVAFAQLCVRHDFLVYHYHLATSPCKRFTKFINNPGYIFAMVDTTNDLNALDVLGLTCQNLVNIHEHYKVWGSTSNK